ncbi:MAG TPA: hypothetical protein VEZ12_06950 [Herpetosiphonaceae bacterium]|nr:hypothetical protein [Herpetosiphonaceae bacterium]
MCGHKKVHKRAERTPERPYEGETIRLGSQGETAFEPAHARPPWKHVPWWALWLIWPLFGLLKPLVQTAAEAGAVLLDLLTPALLLPLWPAALILIGLLLLRWRGR